MSATPDRQRPLILGHRGARAVQSIPENTIASFERAMSDGADGFEFDIRLTADGEVVVCHDPRYRQLELARVSGEKLSELARFEQVLVGFAERAFLDIELKVEGLEKITLELLRKNPPRRGFVVSSFLPEVLQRLRDADAEVPLGLICETRDELAQWARIPVQYVIPHYSRVHSPLVQELRSAGKRILVWTVNDPREMRRLADLSVDGIISDDPGLLKRTISER